MKRMINYDKMQELDEILSMSKITDKIVDKTITGDFGKFLYFSQAQHSAGPRVKFYGGGNNLSTQGSPYMEFDSSGAGKVVGDSKKFPNVDNKDYIQKVRNFVNKFCPLLLLVWYNRLDDGDLTAYFLGKYTWKDLMESILVENPDFTSCKTVAEVDDLCKKHNLYNFPGRSK